VAIVVVCNQVHVDYGKTPGEQMTPLLNSSYQYTHHHHGDESCRGKTCLRASRYPVQRVFNIKCKYSAGVLVIEL